MCISSDMGMGTVLPRRIVATQLLVIKRRRQEGHVVTSSTQGLSTLTIPPRDKYTSAYLLLPIYLYAPLVQEMLGYLMYLEHHRMYDVIHANYHVY